jgi:hypothetical protein
MKFPIHDPSAESGQKHADDVLESLYGHIGMAEARLDLLHSMKSLESHELRKDQLPANIVTLFGAGLKHVETKQASRQELTLRALDISAGSEDGVTIPDLRSQLFDCYLSDLYLIKSNYANVSQTTKGKYTIRLSQILNPYFACLSGFFAVTASINNGIAYYWDNNQTFVTQHEVARDSLREDSHWSTQTNAKFKARTWSSDVTKTERKDVIVAHWGWVLALSLLPSYSLLQAW